VFAVAARDLINEPQNLVNLFTYKYDRDYPRDVQPRPWMVAIIIIGMVPAFYFFIANTIGHSIGLKWMNRRPRAHLSGVHRHVLCFRFTRRTQCGSWVQGDC